MINKISFRNFKLFNQDQDFELKPITILIGKNSSGKSALAKLPTLISESLKGVTEDPFSWENDGVILGANYSDLNHGKETTGLFKFELVNAKGVKFSIDIQFGKNSLYVSYWNYDDKFVLKHDLASKKHFLNIDGHLYNCKFWGFGLLEVEGLKISIPSLDDFKFDFDYICSYRIQPDKIVEDQPKERNIEKVGIDGRYAYEILINDLLHFDSELLNKVSDWYKKTFEGWGINIDHDTTRNKFYFELKRDAPSLFKTSLENVGQGISQTLPLITKSFILEEEPSLTIVEEPELHLHPSAHGDLAERFAESLKDKNKRYLIETHSENFILRLRRLIAEKKFDYFTDNDINIYFVKYDSTLNESILEKIKVKPDGNVENWPRGIFSESLDEILAMKNTKK
jgi:energy-coupling factor transporter ATP-binding protein EcfA2